MNDRTTLPAFAD